MAHVAVGIGYQEAGTKMKIVLTGSDDTFYLSPKQARNLALDLIIQADRLEKENMWDALKGDPPGEQ